MSLNEIQLRFFKNRGCFSPCITRALQPIKRPPLGVFFSGWNGFVNGSMFGRKDARCPKETPFWTVQASAQDKSYASRFTTHPPIAKTDKSLFLATFLLFCNHLIWSVYRGFQKACFSALHGLIF